jgi:hypothetical protein
MKKNINIGDVFGSLTVIEFDADKSTKKNPYYKCQCQCSNNDTLVSIRKSSLVNGTTRSCGCLTQKLKLESYKKNGTKLKGNPQGKAALAESNRKRAEESARNLIGQKFHHLTIKEVNTPYVTCICDCGSEKIAHRSDVVSGKTSSCGCMRGIKLRKNRKDWPDTWVGRRWGMLEVIEDLPKSRVKVKCDCGIIKELALTNVGYGEIKSCGCKSVEMRHETNLAKYNTKNPSVCISKGETELSNWIKNALGLETTRKLIRNGNEGHKYFELDIVIESKNIAIEYNGARWHCDLHKDKHYHKNKTNAAKAAGYRLIHIFDFEWLRNKNAVKSFLRSALGLNERKIAARKCEVRLAPIAEAKKFLNDYHILGFTPGKYIGLYHNDELVSVSVFRNHHIKNEGTVLARWCGKDGVTVQGGLSKIMKNLKPFLGEDVKEVISWADLRISEAKGYLASGWDLDAILDPDYFYYNPIKKTVIYKYRRRKTVANTPAGMTEKEHAQMDGLYKIWDCGKVRLKYNIS